MFNCHNHRNTPHFPLGRIEACCFPSSPAEGAVTSHTCHVPPRWHQMMSDATCHLKMWSVAFLHLICADLEKPFKHHLPFFIQSTRPQEQEVCCHTIQPIHLHFTQHSVCQQSGKWKHISHNPPTHLSLCSCLLICLQIQNNIELDNILP